VTYSVTDPKGNVIFKQKDVTSRFGISAADCILATEILEGDYTIQSQVGATASEQTVRVEKYVLPKFKAALSLDKPFYAPGEFVTGSLQADYFFGKPVAGSAVDFDVRGMDVSQYVITEFKEKTGPEGRAEFRFRLPDRLTGREQESGNARFMIVATVTDSAGQSHSVGTSRIVTSAPIRIEIIPESGSLVRGVANTVYVLTSYADGRPAQTRLVVEGRNEEFETNQLGVASLEVTPNSNEVSITVKATNSAGRVGRNQAQFVCGAVAGDFVLRTDRAVYTGGETMQLTALGGGVEPIFVDFIKDGQTILTQQIEMQNGRGQYTFDLPPEMFGTLKICAYRFGSSGLAVRKSRTILVRQAKQLAIQATLDHDEYRPGAKAGLKLTLTDSEGNPVPGAISLKAVDEAVYSVLQQQSNMEQTFFLLEEELLEPVYTIYPGWSPALFSELPQAERIEFEQALFSRTAQQAQGGNVLPIAFTGGQSRDVAATELDRAVVGQLNLDSDSPFSLAASSFSRKVARVTERRTQGLQTVRVAWVAFAIGLVCLGVAAFAVYYPRVFLIVSAVGLLGCCLLGWPLAAFLMLKGRAPMPTAEFAIDEAAEGLWNRMDAEMPTVEASPAEAADESMLGDRSEPDSGGSGAPPRVRQWFPETLAWRPELITDDRGEVTLSLELADSITTWRLTTSAVSGQGQLGAAEFPIKVFQPFFVDFNLPVALTRHDEVGVPIVVYNYLDQEQTVELTVKAADWYELLDESTGDEASAATKNRLSLTLGPGEVRSVTYPLRVLQVGRQQLEVTAVASGVSDAVRREIEVVPNGVPVEQVASGRLTAPLDMTLRIPNDAIEGSVQAVVKLYPSSFSQLVEGLDSIFRMPYGCFEQTSSTTYPNILALDYLRRTDKSVPEIEAKARQYIHTGYQRLVSFEVDGGGFDWFGNPPANRTLTAYGLMEFQDMARVHDVDPRLIERTRDWLLAQRHTDGFWQDESRMFNEGLASSVNRGGDADLASTAYIAWAVFADGQASSQAGPTLNYLLAHPAESIDDPYLLAITANAVAAIRQDEPRVLRYLERLDEIKKANDEGTLCWWEQPANRRTTFYGSGRAGDVETTALATLAMLRVGKFPATTKGALSWLIEQKDAHGTWHSTQATVLALKALLEGTGAALGGGEERRVEVALDGETCREFVIPAEQSEVMQQLNLSDLLRRGNEYQLALTDRTNTSVSYQVTFRYYVERSTETPGVAEEPLSVNIAYDRERLSVNETVTAVATVVNNLPEAAPMVILDLPIPGGFAIDPEALDELVGSQKIAKYQITARQAIIYLRRLEPGQSLELQYRLRATMPVQVTVPDGQAYEYYDPDRRGQGGATRLIVEA
jgi:uncharacterized protein YfaS (alpha-2-macroglobulin family)